MALGFKDHSRTWRHDARGGGAGRSGMLQMRTHCPRWQLSNSTHLGAKFRAELNKLRTLCNSRQPSIPDSDLIRGRKYLIILCNLFVKLF